MSSSAAIVQTKPQGLSVLEQAPRQIVVVLGMHRSGTSLCSHMLSMLGVDMADDVGASSSNGSGHWERWEIMHLQDEILALLDRSYNSSLHDFPFPTAWWACPKVRGVQAKIEDFLVGRMKRNTLFGFKDPRTVRLLPLWLQIFKNLNLAPRFILCLREPSQVARSLAIRDGLALDVGEFRTLAYLNDCFRYLPRHDVCVVEYEQWFADYATNITALREFLNIEWEMADAELTTTVAAIIDSNLRHSDQRLAAARQPLVRYFYNLVRSLRIDASRRGDIESFVNQFIAFQQLLWPFERSHRELAALSSRVPDLEAKIGHLEALQVARSEHASQLARRIEDLEADVKFSQAIAPQREQRHYEDIAERQRALSAMAGELRERDERIAELTATLEGHEAAARDQEQKLIDAEAALAQLRAEGPKRDDIPQAS